MFSCSVANLSSLLDEVQVSADLVVKWLTWSPGHSEQGCSNRTRQESWCEIEKGRSLHRASPVRTPVCLAWSPRSHFEGHGV